MLVVGGRHLPTVVSRTVLYRIGWDARETYLEMSQSVVPLAPNIVKDQLARSRARNIPKGRCLIP